MQVSRSRGARVMGLFDGLLPGRGGVSFVGRRAVRRGRKVERWGRLVIWIWIWIWRRGGFAFVFFLLDGEWTRQKQEYAHHFVGVK